MNLQDNLLSADYTEVSLHECGREKCKSDKVVKNASKNYHLFHYILYGSGTLVYEDHTYHLRKGDLFYISPGKRGLYYPNPDDPWIYSWIGFSGSKIEKYLQRIGLSDLNPVYRDNKHLELKPLFNDLADKYNRSKFLNIEVLSIFLNIIYKMMISDHSQDLILTSRQMHIREAKQFIENNFQFQLRITDIADAISLNPNYLANIFKAELNISPKKYLTEYRIYQACNMLTHEDSSIQDIAKRVGYPNSLHFSSEFKKVKGIPPSTFRKHNKL